jgi:hypothetical protein
MVKDLQRICNRNCLLRDCVSGVCTFKGNDFHSFEEVELGQPCIYSEDSMVKLVVVKQIRTFCFDLFNPNAPCGTSFININYSPKDPINPIDALIGDDALNPINFQNYGKNWILK